MTRFTLDEDKAREMIAQLLYGYEGEIAAQYTHLCEIADEYDPRQQFEGGSDTFNLVADARDAGVITGPGEVDYDHCDSGDGEIGYVWIVRPKGTPLKLTSIYESIGRAGDPDAAPGAEAALAMLREAVGQANLILDDLDAYVASRAASQREGHRPD